MTTTEERVSYIEGRLDSLATKADLAGLKADMIERMGNLKGEITIRMILIQLAGLAAIAAIIRFLA